MAGRGPAPKPAAERRRANKPTEEVELPSDGYAGEYPELPKTWTVERVTIVRKKNGDKETKLKSVRINFLKLTRDWYKEWATSPMATEFTGVHWRRLQLLAKIVDQYERTGSKDLLAEIRLQEAGFGGTPLDLRRLGRKIAAKGSGEAEQSKPSSRSSARRGRLSLVK